MSAASERIQSLLRQMRQRKERRDQATSAWKKALPRCAAIAGELVGNLDGVKVRIVTDGQVLQLHAPNEASAVFAFDEQQLSLVGRRTSADKRISDEMFFSLRVEPPQRFAAANIWGPSPREGLEALAPTAGSQEAFEKAVADWLEWALAGDGNDGHAWPLS